MAGLLLTAAVVAGVIGIVPVAGRGKLDASERKFDSCLRGYGISLAKERDGLILRGEINRMQEAVLGNCRPLLTDSINAGSVAFFKQVDLDIVGCLRGQQVEATFDGGVNVPSDAPAGVVDRCLASVYGQYK